MESGRIINTSVDKPDTYMDLDGDCTYDNIPDATDCSEPGEIIELDTFYKGPQVYVVTLGKDWDEDAEEYGDYETKTYHDKAEAKAAAVAFDKEDEIHQAVVNQNCKARQAAYKANQQNTYASQPVNDCFWN